MSKFGFQDGRVKVTAAIFYAPATRWGGAYSFTLVCTSVSPSIILCITVLVSATPPRVFYAGFETCTTLQTCIEHVYKGKRILIQLFFAEYCPLE